MWYFHIFNLSDLVTTPQKKKMYLKKLTKKTVRVINWQRIISTLEKSMRVTFKNPRSN